MPASVSASVLGIGLSGMQAYQSALSVTANNIANANTPGFQPQQPVFQESTPPGYGVRLANPVSGASQAPASSTAPSATDLANELVQMLVYKTGFEASAKVVKTSGQMLGALLDTMA